MRDAFTIQEEAAAITVKPDLGSSDHGAGGTATFTVVLGSTPTANVTIGLNRSDTTEGTVSPTSLTFTLGFGHLDAPGMDGRGSGGAAQQTPNLASVVEQIVCRAGWVSGNPLVLIITGCGTRTTESSDGSAPGAALLHVEYN